MVSFIGALLIEEKKRLESDKIWCLGAMDRQASNPHNRSRHGRHSSSDRSYGSAVWERKERINDTEQCQGLLRQKHYVVMNVMVVMMLHGVNSLEATFKYSHNSHSDTRFRMVYGKTDVVLDI